MAVDRVNDAAFVHEHVVKLNRTRRRAFWRWGDKRRDLFRLERIGNVVGAHTTIKESANDDLVRLPGGRDRWILVNIVRAETPATIGIGIDRRKRAGGYRDKI